MCEADDWEDRALAMLEPEIRKYFDKPDRNIINIHWNGFVTDWQALVEAGWKLTLKTKYADWRVSGSNDYLYIRNPELSLIGRLNLTKMEKENRYSATLDYLTPERNRRVKKIAKVFEEKDLTVDDVPALLELILKLQADNKPKLKHKLPPRDNVVPMSLERAQRLMA